MINDDYSEYIDKVGHYVQHTHFNCQYFQKWFAEIADKKSAAETVTECLHWHYMIKINRVNMTDKNNCKLADSD